MKLNKFFTLLFIFSVFFTFFIFESDASANHYSGHPCRSPIELGRCQWHSYFDNDFDTTGNEVFPQGDQGVYSRAGMPVYNVDQFVSYIKNNMNSSDRWRSNAARFVVQSMLGINGSSASTSITPSHSRVVEWEKRVRALDADGRINWDRWRWLPAGTINSYRQDNTGGADFAFYDIDASQTRYIIEIRDYNNNVVFRIKKNCGNPIGPMAEIPEVPVRDWDYDDKGSPTISNYNPYAGQSINVTAGVRNISSGSNAGTGPNYWQEIQWRYDGSGSWSRLGSRDNSKPRLAPGANGPNVTRTFNIPSNISDQRQICFRIVYRPGRGTVNTSNNTFNITSYSEGSPSRCVNVDNRDWDYRASPPSASNTNPKPGQTVSVTGQVRNVGYDSGQNYYRRVQYRIDSGSWTNLGSRDWEPAIAARSSGTNFTRNYTVPAGTEHDQRVCFRMWFDPAEGGRTPPKPTTGPRTSGQTCVYVYNLRFNIEFNNSNMNPQAYAPGTTDGRAEFTLENNANANMNGGDPGRSINLNISASEYGGNDHIDITSVDVSTGTDGTSSAVLRRMDNKDAPSTSIPTQRNVTVYFDVKDTVQPGDQICVRLVASPSHGYSDGTGWAGSVAESASCARVGEHAFMEVRNGSVWAGAGWSDTGVIGGSICNDFPASDSYIRTHLDRPNDQGSFAEYAGVANNDITGFDTRSVGEDYFTFSNVGTPQGNYAQNNKCITDYYDYLRKSGAGVTEDPTPPHNIGSMPSGQYSKSSSLNIPSAQTVGNQIVYIVDGDVKINGNINYPTYSVSSGEDIPFFMLVASGNITIAPGVTELEGVYISKGKINTCNNALPAQAITPARLTINRCDQQLTVRGMFVAEDIEFRRTFGGILREGGPAELFEFSPEVYLANPNFLSDYEDNFSAAQIKELPPLY